MPSLPSRDLLWRRPPSHRLCGEEMKRKRLELQGEDKIKKEELKKEDKHGSITKSGQHEQSQLLTFLIGPPSPITKKAQVLLGLIWTPARPKPSCRALRAFTEFNEIFFSLNSI
jgi:hypothetical protein